MNSSWEDLELQRGVRESWERKFRAHMAWDEAGLIMATARRLLEGIEHHGLVAPYRGTGNTARDGQKMPSKIVDGIEYGTSWWRFGGRGTPYTYLVQAFVVCDSYVYTYERNEWLFFGPFKSGDAQNFIELDIAQNPSRHYGVVAVAHGDELRYRYAADERQRMEFVGRFAQEQVCREQLEIEDFQFIEAVAPRGSIYHGVDFS